MATPAQIRAAQIAAKRHRTPLIKEAHAFVEVGPVGYLHLHFDKPMDTTKTTAVFHYCDPHDGKVYEFTDFSWEDEKTANSTTVTEIGPYSGPHAVVYISGNFRAKARYPLTLHSRTGNITEH